jgi:hypothetical protein
MSDSEPPSPPPDPANAMAKNGSYALHFGRGNRQPFQFSLRALMIVTAAVAACAAIIVRWGIPGAFGIAAGIAIFQIVRGVYRRRIELAVGGAIALLALIVFSPVGAVRIEDGSTVIPLSFKVVDSATGKPIQGATVRLRRGLEYATMTVAPGEHGVQATTGPDGAVVLSEEFCTVARTGTIENSAFVYLHYYGAYFWVQAQAPGYDVYLEQLTDLVGKRRDFSDRVPPITRITLVREHARNDKSSSTNDRRDAKPTR